VVETRRQDLVDVVHGVRVADPIAGSKAPTIEVRAWVDAQNRLLEHTLERVQSAPRSSSASPEYSKSDGSRCRRFDAPPKRTLRYFYTKRQGDQDQPVLLVRDGVGSTDQVLLDPTSLSADGTTSLGLVRPSWDGALVAYGTSEGRERGGTLRIRELRTAKICPTRSPARTPACAGCLTASVFLRPLSGSGERSEGRKNITARSTSTCSAATQAILVFGQVSR
jgi:prolyl oligopeptidase